jgi:hypothetical protein
MPAIVSMGTPLASEARSYRQRVSKQRWQA